MPTLNFKPERFCNLVAEGSPAGRAYALVWGCGILSGKANSSRLMRREDVKARIAEIRGRVGGKVDPVVDKVREKVKLAPKKSKPARKPRVKFAEDPPHCVTVAALNAVESLRDTAAERLAEALNPLIAQFLEDSKYVFDAMTRRRYLAAIALTPIGEIDMMSPLCQYYQTTETSTTIKMPDKIRALELDAKLAGELKDPGAQINVGCDQRRAIVVMMPSAISRPRPVKAIEI
jgi:hypothetical protein